MTAGDTGFGRTPDDPFAVRASTAKTDEGVRR